MSDTSFVPSERRVLFSIKGNPVHKPRRPRTYLADITGGQAAYPLLILFGLNAVDELDRTVFGILGPEIRDHFGLTNQGYLTMIALTLLGGLLLEIPLAFYADRLPRARIAVGGAAVWAIFGLLTGLAGALWVLLIARSGAGMGRAVVGPTHNSLIADLYPIEKRTEVYGFHRMANALGAFIGPLVGGILAQAFGWRVPFIIFVIPTIVFVVLGLRLKEPGRGHYEREAAGATGDVITTDELPPSWAESVRILWQVKTLRRIWASLPFLAASVIGLVTLTSLYYEEVCNLSEGERGAVAAATEPAQLVGITLGIPLAARLMRKDPGHALRMLSLVAVAIAVAWVIFATAPVLGVAVAANVLVSGLAALLGPGIFASLSLAIPPKVRSLGFSMASLFILPGLIALYVVGGLADRYGLRTGMLVMVPIFLVGAMVLASAAPYVKGDISKVWTSTAAQAEVLHQRSLGEVKLLLVRNLDVGYDGVQVLFNVDFEIDQGEDPAAMQGLVMQIGMNPGKPLSSLLTEDQNKRLNAAGAKYGLPPNGLDPFKPWMAGLTLSVLPLMQSGFDVNSGVETVITAEAKAGGKTVRAFETAEQQLRFFDGLPLDLQIEFLMSSVDGAEEGAKMLDTMVAGWAKGDTAVLEKAMVDDMRADYPEFYKVIIIDRNEAWAVTIEEMLKGSGTVFIAVGAGHLVGPDSVQALLKKRGITAYRY